MQFRQSGSRGRTKGRVYTYIFLYFRDSNAVERNVSRNYSSAQRSCHSSLRIARTYKYRWRRAGYYSNHETTWSCGVETGFARVLVELKFYSPLSFFFLSFFLFVKEIFTFDDKVESVKMSRISFLLIEYRGDGVMEQIDLNPFNRWRMIDTPRRDALCNRNPRNPNAMPVV